MSLDIEGLLGDKATYLLEHKCETISRDLLSLPGPDFVTDVLSVTDRSPQVMRNMQSLFNNGRLASSGYVSILPVDQGIEHSGAASFAPNPIYFDPANIVELALEGGCNAVATTFGVLGYPATYDQIMFGSVDQAYELGAAGVGATIYFGSEESGRQIQETAEAFERAHQLGMFTVLWCYLRNSEIDTEDQDNHVAADATAQANHIGVTIEADIIKQKLPETNGAFNLIKGFGKTHPDVYDKLTSDHPIDLCRWQVANCYMGRIGLINSGGASSGATDMAEAVMTAVVNKRAGGLGLISGRKAFQRPMREGVDLLNAIQDVYLNASITVA